MISCWTLGRDRGVDIRLGGTPLKLDVDIVFVDATCTYSELNSADELAELAEKSVEDVPSGLVVQVPGGAATIAVSACAREAVQRGQRPGRADRDETPILDMPRQHNRFLVAGAGDRDCLESPGYDRPGPHSRQRAGHLLALQTNGRRWLLSTSVLVSGGAGFIGSALSCRLVKGGYDVAVMDVLHPQVHGGRGAIDLPPSVRLFTGDVTHAP